MKKYNFITLILTGFLIAFSILSAHAQEEMPPADAPAPNFNKKPRPNLLAELELTPNQIQEIRRINQDIKPKRREAQQRVMEAQKALDEAIYSDSVDEADIQARLKTLQLAQAEIIKMRSMTEFAVRRILNPEQLARFRELRRRFMEGAENRLDKPKNVPFNNPNRRFNNRQRPLSPND